MLDREEEASAKVLWPSLAPSCKEDPQERGMDSEGVGEAKRAGEGGLLKKKREERQEERK